jgi:hypothetical protein
MAMTRPCCWMPRAMSWRVAGENIFLVRDGVLYTPDLTSALDGITRRSIIQVAGELGIRVVEKRITRDEVYIADEAFFTGTAAEVTPIREVDNRVIGSGSRGPHHPALTKSLLRSGPRSPRRASRVAHAGLTSRFPHEENPIMAAVADNAQTREVISVTSQGSAPGLPPAGGQVLESAPPGLPPHRKDRRGHLSLLRGPVTNSGIRGLAGRFTPDRPAPGASRRRLGRRPWPASPARPRAPGH